MTINAVNLLKSTLTVPSIKIQILFEKANLINEGKKMKNKLNQLLPLLFLFVSSHAYSESINAINFIGLNNTSGKTLLKEIPIKVGDEYSDSATNAIIQSLFQTGLF